MRPGADTAVAVLLVIERAVADEVELGREAAVDVGAEAADLAPVAQVERGAAADVRLRRPASRAS